MLNMRKLTCTYNCMIASPDTVCECKACVGKQHGILRGIATPSFDRSILLKLKSAA